MNRMKLQWQKIYLPGYIGGKPFSDAIVANWAAIDSNEVIFCCGNVCLNKSATDFDVVVVGVVCRKVFCTSLSEQSLESLSDSNLVCLTQKKKKTQRN